MTAGRLAAAASVAVAVAAAAHPARAEELVERFTGTARGAEGAVLYLEEHAVRRTAERLDATTTYRDADGRTIAVLRTDFSRDPFAPSYAFEDLRTGAVEAASLGTAERRPVLGGLGVAAGLATVPVCLQVFSDAAAGWLVVAAPLWLAFVAASSVVLWRARRVAPPVARRGGLDAAHARSR